MKLIAESAALVYPSLYEGYGLAIAEGFMAGVPVVAGRGGSQAEVGGPGVYYIDPLDVHAIALAMEAVLTPNTRAELAKGRASQSAVIFGPQIVTTIQEWFTRNAGVQRKGAHE
jgi:alpha-1,3-rhamnosyl/mannosyltransferase